MELVGFPSPAVPCLPLIRYIVVETMDSLPQLLESLFLVHGQQSWDDAEFSSLQLSMLVAAVFSSLPMSKIAEDELYMDETRTSWSWPHLDVFFNQDKVLFRTSTKQSAADRINGAFATLQRTFERGKTPRLHERREATEMRQI